MTTIDYRINGLRRRLRVSFKGDDTLGRQNCSDAICRPAGIANGGAIMRDVSRPSACDHPQSSLHLWRVKCSLATAGTHQDPLSARSPQPIDNCFVLSSSFPLPCVFFVSKGRPVGSVDFSRRNEPSLYLIAFPFDRARNYERTLHAYVALRDSRLNSMRIAIDHAKNPDETMRQC